MSIVVPIAYLLLSGAIWCLLAYAHFRLLDRFKQEYPAVAIAKIPYAFSWWVHPEKILYFFRQESRRLLRRNPSLWRHAKLFFFLFAVSIIFPVVGFGAIALYAFLNWW